MSDWVLTEAQRKEINQKLATHHAEVTALRADLAKAREEVKQVRRDGMAHHEHIIDRYRRDLTAAERARDEAMAALRDLYAEVTQKDGGGFCSICCAEHATHLSPVCVRARRALGRTDVECE